MNGEKAKYILAVVLYGTIGMLLHYITLPSEVVVLCRGVIGTGTILMVMLARRRPPRWRTIRPHLPILAVSGACLGLNWIFLFAAYRATTVAVASLCNYMAPVLVIAVSPAVFGERLTRRKAGCILMTYEVGIRFLADYLNGDVYFRVAYPQHNLDRARNQFKLVAEMEQNRPQMAQIIARYAGR